LQFPDLRQTIDEACQQYAKAFEENKAAYARQDGYNMRLHAARLALARMEQVAKGTNNGQAAETFRNRMEQYKDEIDRLQQEKKW